MPSPTEEGERLKVVQLDVDTNPETTNAYKVLSMPTFMVFRGGEPVKVDGGGAAQAAAAGGARPTCSDLCRYTKKSPEQLRSGDFFGYIQWFATSR